MQEFALSLQKALTEHMQSTMKLQADVLRAVQDPIEKRAQDIGGSLQKIFAEQVNLVTASMTNPMSNQLDDFAASVQRIMSEQLQVFASSTANPTPEQLDDFFDAMRDTMAEQMQFAAELQGAMSKQMQQFMDSLHTTMTTLAGSGASQQSDRD
jgi:hypothetical protein